MTTSMAKAARRRPLCTFTMDPDLVEGLERLRERDGTTASETVRRAVRQWLNRKGILTQPPVGPMLPWDSSADPLASPQLEQALDEADLELLLRALQRLRVGSAQEARRRRLASQLEREIADLVDR